MTLLGILKLVALIATVLTGFVSLVAPRSVYGFTGLSADGVRGISEIRAVLGGLFIGVGLAPIFLRDASTYRLVGIMYLAIAVARLVSIFVDRSYDRSNLISLVVEIVLGIILVL